MSTVYITKELTNQIKKRIEKMRDQEVSSELPNHDKAITTDATELLMQMAWGDHRTAFLHLPKEWLKKNTTPDFYVVTAENENGKSEKYTITLAGVQNYYEPPTAERWGSESPRCTKEWLQSKAYLTGAQDILNQLEQKETRVVIYSKWEKVNSDIQLFLNKCKSLNEALRLWPALKMYVAEEYIERVETKVERRKRETDIIETVDLGELTAAAIAAKLSGVV